MPKGLQVLTAQVPVVEPRPLLMVLMVLTIVLVVIAEGYWSQARLL